MSSANYEKEHLARRHPAGSQLSYGYSFVLSWIVFLIYLGAAIIYFICSKKRKRDKARSEKEAIENEPIHLGRM
ncbi:hypothetical protein LSH36_10g04012 [Paralvinella palmiformis]|uniref:Uncharacterized protein n=1 Tax=Paralvinella palmiformis TaxID=53620 RepID=A0AAD9KCZ6_9ANNE|nr:hypothetical protein LSH36_10g04012 [Paralvinella palmiformis]